MLNTALGMLAQGGWNALAAIGGVVSAIAALVAVGVAVRQSRALSEPKIIVYVRHDDNRPTILEIVIENIGRDTATDIKFSSTKPIPRRAWGVATADNSAAGKIIDSGPLISGIAALHPNERRAFDWGQYGGLSAALNKEPLRLRFTYSWGRIKYFQAALLDVESFLWTAANESVPAKIASSLAVIAKSSEALARYLAAERNESDL